MTHHSNYDDPHVRALLWLREASQRQETWRALSPLMAMGWGGLFWYQHGKFAGVALGIAVFIGMWLYPNTEVKKAEAYLARVEGRD